MNFLKVLYNFFVEFSNLILDLINFTLSLPSRLLFLIKALPLSISCSIYILLIFLIFIFFLHIYSKLKG